MAYETGVSTSTDDLLSKIYNFAIANGWTGVRNNGATSSGTSVQRSISDPGAAEANQWNMVSVAGPATAEIRLQPSTGDSGSGTQFFAHTGTPSNAGTAGTYVRMGHGTSGTDQGFSGPHVAYYLFSSLHANGRVMHVVCEGTAGVFFHMIFGTVLKAASYTGGQFAMALTVFSASSGLISPGQSGVSNAIGTQWFRVDNTYTAGSPGWRTMNWAVHTEASGPVCWTGNLYQSGLIEFNSRSPFGAIIATWYATNSPTSIDKWLIAGHLPDMRQVSMDGREPGEIVTLGSDTWHIFPVHRKNTATFGYGLTNVSGPAPNNHSNLAGFAYREVP